MMLNISVSYKIYKKSKPFENYACISKSMNKKTEHEISSDLGKFHIPHLSWRVFPL